MCCEILPILETKFNLLNRVLRTSLEFGESSNFNCSSIIKNANEINRLVLVHDVTAKSQKGKTASDIFRLRAQLSPPPIEFSFAASSTARTSRTSCVKRGVDSNKILRCSIHFLLGKSTERSWDLVEILGQAVSVVWSGLFYQWRYQPISPVCFAASSDTCSPHPPS